MFRIESYVTPIILENVAKYVKNIRPQDFQMSLWEGEVAFANLDLRLDVLEEELNLPFEFLSGHIHNLNIQVPWTKIVSEPIRVIIKTIEFVLKLKDPNKEQPGSSTSATSSPQHSQATKPKRNNKQLDSSQAQQSAGSGLVNKIIQNISIECHNIILKYVEEDIVVSMNVQLLSFGAANEKWEPAMIDVHPVKVLSRKLIKISDLTICLDKRNSAGQIEVCQEPILYRCSLECRILQKYNINTKSTTSKIRIGLFTKSIDLNISALQFPMIMRLVNLAMTLNASKSSSPTIVDNIEDDNVIVEDDNNEASVSYLSWAWNLLPSFNFELPYADDQSDAEQPGHMMNLGVYVEELNITFKNSEILTDSSLGGAKRIRYSSIVRISFGGIYFESIKAEERNWSSIKAGVSNICIEPLGTYKPDDHFPNAFIEGEMLADQNSFIDKSLFDERTMVSDKNWGITSYEEYITRTTDEYLLFRSPILAFDLIEYKSPKAQEDEDLLTEVTHRELEKHTEYRLLSAGMTFRYNEALLQVINVITEFIKSYDYPAYHAENLDRVNTDTKMSNASKVSDVSAVSRTINIAQKLHPPIMEDYDALMQHIPLRRHKFSCRSIKIELYPKTTPEYMKTSSTESFTLKTSSSRRKLDNWKRKLPYFLLSINYIEGSFITPLEPDKLVHTTCQLPQKPPTLVKACYDIYQLLLEKISLKLINNYSNRRAQLLSIPKLHVKFCNLLQPELWKEDELPKQKLNVSCDELLIEFSKRESIGAYRLLRCIMQFESLTLWKLLSQMLRRLTREDLIRMQNNFQKLHFKQRIYHNYMIINLTLSKLESSFVSLRDIENTKQLFLITTSKLHNLDSKWLEFQAQLPTKSKGSNGENNSIVPMIGIWIESYRFYIDISSIKFLKYQEDYLTAADKEQFELMLSEEQPLKTIKSTSSTTANIIPVKSKEQFVHKSSRASSSQRKVGNPIESIHLSSERDGKVMQTLKEEETIKTTYEKIVTKVKFIESLVLYIEIANGHISISDTFVHKFVNNEFTDIQLAKVLVKSLNTELISRSDLKQKLELKKSNVSVPYKLEIQLTDFQIERRILEETQEILRAVQTNITISLISKKNKLYNQLDMSQATDNKRYSPQVQQSIDYDEFKDNSRNKFSDDRNSDSLSISSLERKKEDSFLREMQRTSYEQLPQPVVEKKPLVLERKTIMITDAITINLHIDATPIVFLLCSRTFRTLYRDIIFVGQIMTQAKLAADESDVSSSNGEESIQIITATEKHPDLKSFIEQETQTNNSEPIKNDVSNENVAFILSLLCQCTITKIKLELLNDLNFSKHCKMVFELEDVLFSLDKSNDYTKITNKIGQANVIYYEQLMDDEWKAHENLRVKILGETSNLPFLNITVTIVTLKSFFDKMGINQKSEQNPRTLTEILIAMEAIEIICDIDKIINLIEPLCVLFESNDDAKLQSPVENDKQITNDNKPIAKTKKPIISINMPLIQFDSKGIVLYLPLETVEKRCSVTILKIENITITTNLENPLVRKPIHSDVYSKAAQLGMLNTPGAAIEDRQYELRLKNISLSTANWSQVVQFMREQTNNLAHLNPAFEWNNPGRGSNSKIYTSRTIFSQFTFLSSFAPCIAYNNILISGQALEFNCVSDFKALIDLYQLSLLSCTSARLSNLSVIINRICNKRICSPPDAAQLSDDESSVSYRSMLSTETSIEKVFVRKNNEIQTQKLNSFHKFNEQNNSQRNLQTSKQTYGIAQTVNHDRLSTISSSSSILQEQIEYMNPVLRHVPSTISFVAGIFFIKIIKKSMDEEERDKKNISFSLPLFTITISQPSFMFTQSIYDAMTQISLFNLVFSVGKLKDSKEKYNYIYETIIDTQTVRSEITGITPPLIVIKSHRTKMQLQEIDIEVSKSLIISIKEKCMMALYQNYLLIYEVLRENPCLNLCIERPVTRLSKIKLMRQQCLNADRLNFVCDKMTLIFKDDTNYNCILVLAETKAHIKFLMRPEKATIKLSVSSCYLQTDNKIFVHPIALRVSTDFVSEPWYSLPLVTVIVKVGVVRVDFGITVLLQLRESMNGVNRILKLMEEEWNKLMSKNPARKNVLLGKRLVHIKCPKTVCDEKAKQKKIQIKSREEFYQDDLRAGAFQFVELKSESFLPLPYQILIVKKNYGVICWRYPQPRRMCRIQVFPVPMATENPVQIKCRMEYFSEVHEGFKHYCDFTLSETISKIIKLPEREICANIWRVIIMQSLISVNGECFENSDEDDELHSIPSQKVHEVISLSQIESEFILHPKILVGCMRIDTSFKSICVPTIQFLITCPLFKVLILNQPNQNGELPTMFKKYRLTQLTTISQTIFKMCIENMNLHASIFSTSDILLENDFEAQITFLDQGFLNMLYFLEKMKVENVVNIKKSPKSLTINTLIDRLRINVGPTLMNSLFSMKFHWEEFLSTKAENLSQLHAVIPKFLVVNRTYSAVSFGQTGTTERIQLQRKECHLYSFYSDYHNQELTFFINDDETKITEASQSVPIPLKFEGKMMLQHIRIGNKCIIVKSNRLSATQIAILIKGQIEFISMVPHNLHIEFRHDNNTGNKKMPSKEEYEVEIRGRYCFYKAVNRDSNIFMRIKSLGIGGKGRSGDIPLNTNKHLPWLVKVPVKNYDFISFWVRILRENIQEFDSDIFRPQKVLITIWPIYVISSMLTSPIICEESHTGKKFTLNPGGGRQVLDVPATHLTEHTIKVNLTYPIGSKSKNSYKLSLKNLDWHNFFCYNESLWTIEYSLRELSKGLPSSFPSKDPEEARISRKLSEPKIVDLLYRLRPSRDFSCCQNLEVSPWGIFINATDESIRICDSESNNSVDVDSNGVGMLFAIERPFTVNIKNGTHWIPSLPIFIKKDVDFFPCKVKHYTISESINSIDILILRPNEVLKYVLDYTIEDKRCILKLSSKFAVTNFTKLNLCLLPFAIDHKETINREDVKKLDFKYSKLDLYPTRGTNNCIGHYCNSFFDLNIKGVLRSTDTAFIFFVCFKISEESDISIPIPLSMPFARRCFSIQNGAESIPLVVTLLEKDNVFYLNVFDDISPAILINNLTNVEFLIAQTCSPENTEVNGITSEYFGNHFHWLQHLHGFSKCYYTPPELYINFPDVDSTICNLTLALNKGDDNKSKDIVWSKAISTNQTWQKYLHIPCHGDVKVSICDKHRIVQICISYISQQSEFSAKEIRSRLLLPPSSFRSKDSSSNSAGSSRLLAKLSNATIQDEMSIKSYGKCAHFSQECEEQKQECTARLLIKEIVISLNTDCKDRDFMKKEILNLYIDDLMMVFDDSIDNRKLNVLMGNMQIDNQLHSTGKFDFPVVLCAEKLYKRDTIPAQVHSLDTTYQELRNNEPMVLFTFDFFVDEFCMNSVCCHLSPVRIYIEDNYLTEVLDALIEIDPSNCTHRPESHFEPMILSPGLILLPKSIVSQAICLAEPMRLRSFKIEPLSISLSVHTSVRLYIALDHSPLSFSTYERRHILTIPMRLGQSLGMHYLSGAIFGAGWVVGSLEILGSPSGLARSFTTGFRDFVSLPVQGLFRGPWGFIVGVTQGSASLLRNVTAGTVNSFTKFASSVARNLDRLSLDSEHIERTDALRRSRPSGFTDGVTKGLTGLGISILGAVGGLAHHSLEANSSVGVVTGFGKGIVGALTKPLGGAVELVALAGQGMLQSVGFNAMPQQRAPSVTRNVSNEPSSYRIWKLLPGVLSTDQILIYQQASLMVQKQMRHGYVLLTSAVFVLMEAQWDKLTFICPINKVQITKDRNDKTLFHVSKVVENEEIEEDLNYTNQRIMHFLHSSNSKRQHVMTSDSLNDLLMSKTQIEQGPMNIDCSFFIKEHVGEHIIQYLKVMLSS